MAIVLNEVKQVEEILESGVVGNKPTATLFLLAKYYRNKHDHDKKATINKLNEFMVKNYKNYNPALWEDIIEDISKKANKYPLREIDNIKLTKNELEKIRTTKGAKHQRLLFVMLCYAKLYNAVSENNNGWVNAPIRELYNVGRISVRNKNDKFLMLNDLETAGYITFSNKNDNLNVKVDFYEDDGENVLEINDFRELGYEYLNYIGEGNFIRCERCNRLIKKTNNKCMYCNECAKHVKNEQNKEYYKKRKIENAKNP